ncbi:large ribosomal RNA subunit accumulation protein YCED homolog 1, chloroplastic [Momordica charantia]|uniref:Large ribosomal RNA subunit accumulation protein YCED homolog 1, chloroplastic n=1 Tax=Momordica charantia TaxID=3673 RepID=A0A6J1DQF0_MOMCH|nr:large ribosomal RNA subunit accumulation protein YCED homolog 1, chloroplastic [Momordica charantia]
MSATFPTSLIVSSSHSNEFIRLCFLKSKGNASFNSNFRFVGCKVPFTENIQATMLKFASLKGVKPAYQSLFEDNIIISDWEDQEGDTEEMGSPWEGAVTYKRNSSVSHVEYCTTLERLGFEKLSTDVSKSRASKMGLRVTKAVKDYPFGTPVQISIDVTRKEKKLRLDGIVKTVITLDCYRCCEPAAECVFSNFSLILSEEPIEEPEVINMGIISGQDKFMTFDQNSDQDDEELIDLDDQLYFPPVEKEIDISKNIRDILHLEITMNAICNPGCKGMCLRCGINLNIGSCNCSKQDVKKNDFGPLGNLKRQMQKNS